MTTYFCKCGRPVKKSANADNTGNRDTEGCEGCPYLLPWGPMVWEEGQKAYVQDVKGQECRMSPTINYATTYRGQADDKCTLHIVSMDLDFLDQVQAWIYDNAADTLSAGFSRGSIRAVEFCDQGRYSLSICCAQNKKGMAAKAALLDRFFTASRGRRDMTPAQEKAHILDAIRKGKEQAQRKDTAMKKLNDRCPLQQECERTCKVIGHERDCDYYVNNRYCTEGIPDQDELLAEEEIRQEREREERYLASLSAEPAKPVAYQNEYGTLFAVREHKGAPALMCKAKGADSWALSGVLAAVRGEAYTASDLQEVLDEYARAHGWKKAVPEEKSETEYSPCVSCRCPACDDEACPQAHCDKSDKGLGCIAPDGLCPPANPTDAAADAPPCVPTASDAQTSPSPNADAGAKIGAEEASENPTDAAHTSRAGAGAAAQSLSAAGPASLAAEDMHVPAFDYSGLDLPTRDTLHWAEKEIGEARRDYIARLAQAVSIAHDALCPGVVQNLDNSKHGNRGEEAFTNWCASVGIKRSTAYNLLQVQALLSGSTPEEQATLEAASPSLLYAAAKPSAPAELVQAVKDGDITTHKQYQDLLAKLKDEQAARKEAEKKVKGLADSYATAHKNEEFSIRNLKKAQQERDEAIKERDGARDALKAVKMRADKWQAEAEAAKAKPIEAKVVDEAEVNRRAQELADKQTADLRQRLADLQAVPSDAEEASRDAYDAVVYTCRTIENSWKAVKPLLQRMDPDTLPMAANQLAKVLHNIENEVRACL